MLDCVDHENIVRFYAAVVQVPDSYLVMGKNRSIQLKLTAAYCMLRKLSNDLRLVATGSEIESGTMYYSINECVTTFSSLYTSYRIIMYVCPIFAQYVSKQC